MHRCVIMLFCGILITSGGCGGGADDYPDMGKVRGTVTLGGSPLSGASVAFQPSAATGGRASSAVTDANGNYTLKYSANMEGAKVGEHTVRISTYQEAGPGEDGEIADAVPETVPNQYNSQTTLKQTVEQGSNTFDFELSAEGEIDEHDGGSYEEGE